MVSRGAWHATPTWTGVLSPARPGPPPPLWELCEGQHCPLLSCGRSGEHGEVTKGCGQREASGVTRDSHGVVGEDAKGGREGREGRRRSERRARRTGRVGAAAGTPVATAEGDDGTRTGGGHADEEIAAAREWLGVEAGSEKGERNAVKDHRGSGTHTGSGEDGGIERTLGNGGCFVRGSEHRRDELVSGIGVLHEVPRDRMVLAAREVDGSDGQREAAQRSDQHEEDGVHTVLAVDPVDVGGPCWQTKDEMCQLGGGCALVGLQKSGAQGDGETACIVVMEVIEEGVSEAQDPGGLSGGGGPSTAAGVRWLELAVGSTGGRGRSIVVATMVRAPAARVITAAATIAAATEETPAGRAAPASGAETGEGMHGCSSDARSAARSAGRGRRARSVGRRRRRTDAKDSTATSRPV